MVEVERRLAAILAADVVGYSALMGSDEEGTLAALTAHLSEIVEPAVAEHRGRVVKTTGDGLLAEFASVVDAVRCAVAFQQAMAGRNAEIPTGKRVVFRVGINLGDVIIQAGDVFGDGVNIAARLEGLADPGGICVSDMVQRSVDAKLGIGFDDLGEQTVKNIARPVRAYRIRVDGTSPAAIKATATARPETPSIAVLPFDNMSGDAEQDYFADGITEDIITDLSKISGLFVIARNSAFAYKGRSSNIADVSRELGVRHVLEGSVRKAGNRVRINAQLIDGTTGGHVWADRFDQELTDIFAVQDEVTSRIVDALKVQLTVDERSRIGGREEIDPEAYDSFVRGRECVLQFSAEGVAEARDKLARAIVLEPGFAPAYGFLAATHLIEYVNPWGGNAESLLDTAVALSENAIALDADDYHGYLSLALARLYQRRFDQAEPLAEKLLNLAPNQAEACAIVGRVRDYLGRSEEAVPMFEKVLRLDPRSDDIFLQFLGHAQFMLGRYDDAEATFKRRITRNPRSDISRVFLASVCGHAGRDDEARTWWREALEISPNLSLDHMKRVTPYKDPARFERLPEGLRKAGLID